MAAMRICFVDHHLNNYHADTFLKIFRNELADEQIEVVAAYESDPTGDDWCEKSGVPRAASAEAAMEGVDAAIVLAPDSIESHVDLCRAVLPFGKPVFIDKLLAKTEADATEIISLAAENKAPFLCASGLRYAVEFDDLEPGDFTDVLAQGFGVWDRYGVHTVTMALRLLGSDFARLIDTGYGPHRQVTLDYGDRRATIQLLQAENQMDVSPWKFTVRRGERYEARQVVDFHGFYLNLLRAAVRLFKTGEADMTPTEALATVRVLERADRSQAAGGVWI